MTDDVTTYVIVVSVVFNKQSDEDIMSHLRSNCNLFEDYHT